mgnify:CR=1 FL=1
MRKMGMEAKSKVGWLKCQECEQADLIRYSLFGEVFSLEASEALFRKLMECWFIEGVEWEMIEVLKGGKSEK